MDVSTHVRKMLESQKKTLALTIGYGYIANLDLDLFLKVAMETCQVGMLNDTAMSAIEMAADAETEDEFNDIFTHNSTTDCNPEAVRRQQLYKDFERHVRDLFNKASLSQNQPIAQTTTVGNDMEITETSQAIDPITKGPLIRPVRNVRCNHIYGYESVMQSLELNRRLRCPMIGCSNREYIVPADLIEI